MSNRHERRKAAATSAKKSANLNAATLDQHLDETLRRVRAEFERTGEIHSRFECVADAESFDVPAHWPAVMRRVPHVQRCGIPFVAEE
jgi:hypothetical protein